MGLIFDFLKSTEGAKKEDAKEKEEEWKQRNDWVREELQGE